VKPANPWVFTGVFTGEMDFAETYRVNAPPLNSVASATTQSRSSSV
jgi:hypothetical protein